MPGGNRTANRGLAAFALASGKTAADAAKAAGVAERTVKGWKADPEFAASVTELRDGMVSDAAGRLVEAMTAAALVLRKLLTSRTELTQLKAATKLIELGVRLVEFDSLQERIAELERWREAQKS